MGVPRRVPGGFCGALAVCPRGDPEVAGGYEAVFWGPWEILGLQKRGLPVWRAVLFAEICEPSKVS